MQEVILFSSLLIDLFAIAGGGGSGGGGGGGGGGSSFHSSGSGGSGGFSWIGVVLSILIYGTVAVVIIIAAIYSSKQIAARRAKMKVDLAAAAAADVVWEQGSLETQAKDTFVRYQKDWSAFDLDSMKSYMTHHYYQHNLLMMAAMKLMARQNDVQNPLVLSAEIMNMADDVDNSKDSFSIQMSVHVQDVLNDTKDNRQLFSQPLSAVETYNFKRSGKEWKFNGIDQASANPLKRNVILEKFAADNGYFYSLDWGHLLLPARGQLFAKGSFGLSDINNHVIGMYNDIVIQLYNFVPNPQKTVGGYIIAQTAVPKSYGNIVVRRKAGFFVGGTKGLRQLKMEWQDFNSIYEVFASDENLATSFELLNPKFMEQLQALDFEVNIEVVDNIVYLYAPEKMGINNEHYAKMLEVLKAAFKEMRM